MPQVATESRNIESSQQVHTPKAVGSSVVLASMVASKLTNNTIAPNYVQRASPASPVQISNCTGSKRAFSSTSGPHHESPGPEESDAEECPAKGSNDNEAFEQSSGSNKRVRPGCEIPKAFAPTREPLIAVEESQILLLRLKDGSTVEARRGDLMEVPYFNNLFKKEPKYREHHLHEDSPHSIRVLLTVLNQRSAGLFTTMSVAQLSELATLCDKYDISHIFSSVETCRWINALWKDDKPINGDWETWLAILETFKQSTLREKVISVLATNMFVSEGEWIIAREDGLHSISQINCWAKASLQGK
jgi:hypothetical protein